LDHEDDIDRSDLLQYYQLRKDNDKLMGIATEAGQISSYGLDRRYASFEASLREAPQDDDPT
jgi:hypothetical protein